MNADDFYEFHINKFTPQTIPLKRLGEYMAALAKVFGSEGAVHFSQIVHGSVGVVSRIDADATGAVWQRVQVAPTMDAPAELAKAYKAVNDMLYEDGASADLKRSDIKVLRFAGNEIKKPPRMGPIAQSIEVDGVLVRVGGKDKTAHVLIEDKEGLIWSFEVTREQAKNVAAHLFGDPIRVIGTIRWIRDEDGIWQQVPHSAKANSFAQLNAASLSEVIADIRTIYLGSEDKPIAPLALLKHLRNEDGELH
ncbi:MAG: hypothetical protein ACYC7G_08090 [Rudaea sp.]